MAPPLQPEPILATASASEPLLRAARADVAVLRLQVRTTVPEAEAAEAIDAVADWEAAAALLRSSLDEKVARRRRELAAGLDDERRDAERLIDAARDEADAILLDARERARRRATAAPSSAVAGPLVPRGDDETPSAAPTSIGTMSAERMTQVVQAAIAAGFAQVAATAAATVAPLSVGPSGVTARRPLWRRFFYVDVLLPLLAVLLVVAVLLAWVG